MYFKTTRLFKEWWLENSENGYPECEICGTSNAQVWDCDHIMSKGNYPKHDELWNALNLLLVCRRCHTDKNLLQGKYELIIEGRGLRELFKK